MIFVSVTRLHLRSYRYLLPFVWYSFLSSRQAVRAQGFLGGKLMGDGKRAFWTLTLWTDEGAMKAYRNADAHRRAMPKLLSWCNEAAIVHWFQESAELPDRYEAHRRMLSEGRISKVHFPSDAHAAKQTAEPQCAIRTERELRPKQKRTPA